MSDLGWTAGGYYVLAVVSALVPWVNAEVLMLSAVPLAGSRGELALLVALVTAGQMTGKTTVYWIARKATLSRIPRLEQAIERWRGPFARRPLVALGVLLVSSTVGVPPFYGVTLAAGALRLAFGRFLAVGTIGRLAHFALLAFVPQLLWRS